MPNIKAVQIDETGKVYAESWLKTNVDQGRVITVEDDGRPLMESVYNRETGEFKLPDQASENAKQAIERVGLKRPTQKQPTLVHKRGKS